MLWSVLAPVIVLGVLIFVHELGHFLVAKWCGVGVLKFSIGFGPALYEFRWGETRYRVGLIPLGGYVRMVGDIPDLITGPQASDDAVREADEEEPEPEVDPWEGISEEERELLQDRERWFVEKNLWQRSAIVFAGPLFNFLLAIVLIAFSIWFFGEDYAVEEPVLGVVMKESPAAAAGLKAGDRVLSLDGSPVPNWETLADEIRNGTGDPVAVAYRRGEEEQTVQVFPQAQEITTLFGDIERVWLIGIGPEIKNREASLLRASEIAILWTGTQTARTLLGLWGIIRGAISAKELAGPLFIIQEANNQAQKGVVHLLTFMAILSVSLAVLNLLPIPVLDGGHLMFFFMEAVMGPISMRKKEVAQQVGMLLLLGLMVFAIRNDIFRDPADLERGIQWDEKDTKEAPEAAPVQQ